MEKKFLIHCRNCAWKELSTGVKRDLTHLTERVSCTNCGKPREFLCPKCGKIAKMNKIKRP